MDIFSVLTDPVTAAFAGTVYVLAIYVAARTTFIGLSASIKNKRRRRTRSGRHVAGSYAERWATPTTPRHKALTDAPERYLSTWDTAPIKVATQPIPVRTQPLDTNVEFFLSVMRETA